MADQADNLRKLIRAAPVTSPVVAGGAPLVAVSGCRAGVGATTVAVNVAAAIADRGTRVLVVDADYSRPNLSEVAGLRSSCEYTLADAVAGKCKLADVVVKGPGGMMVVVAGGRGGLRSGSANRDGSRLRESRKSDPSWDRQLLASLRALRGNFDVMIVDTGAGLSRTARRLWLRAQLAMLVTTSDDAAVMDAYAAVKLHVMGARDASCANLRVLVNQATPRAAEDAHRRLTNCCQRFLRQSISCLPSLPRFADQNEAPACLHPRVWELPDSAFGHAALWLGRAVSDVLEACRPTVAEGTTPRERERQEPAPRDATKA